MSFRSKFIGDKVFYKTVLKLVVPMIVQSLITSFVSLLDNIMVGQVGTAEMSGVSIANQLMFVFNLTLFGALSGIGIFTAQYFGAEDTEGVQNTIRLKIIVSVMLAGVFLLAAYLWGEPLISLFLTADDDPAQVEVTLTEGMKYLRIALIGVLPFIVSQVYSSSLKESGETKLPMYAGVAAVFVNLVGNYIFIFGHFGAPEMGVSGAALATVISRFVETFIVVFFSHRHTERFPFLEKLYSLHRIPMDLIRKVIYRGTPLLVNEFLWSFGVSAITQSYSTRGLAAVAAVTINSTVFNLLGTAYASFGSCISILVGQALGSGDEEKAVDLDRKIMTFSVMTATCVGLISCVIAPLFPKLYNTTEEVRALTTGLLRVSALCMPIGSLVHGCYFTLRTGGKTMITFLFDSVFTCGVDFPVSFLLSRFTSIPLIPLYLIMQLMDLIKVVIGLVLVKKGVWINNLVENEQKQEGSC